MKKLFFYSLIMLSFLAPAALQARSHSEHGLWDEQDKMWVSFKANGNGMVVVKSHDKDYLANKVRFGPNLQVVTDDNSEYVGVDTIIWD